MTPINCGSGHVQHSRGRGHSVRWKCLSCELELDFGLIEQPARCACGSRGWRRVGSRPNTSWLISATQRT